MKDLPPHVLDICPICRERAASVEGDEPRIYVECHACGARGPHADTELDAIERWNSRGTIECADMTDAQQRIVDSGNMPPAGVFPSGLTREELIAWMKQRFGS
jgi:hypothetical protein